MLPLHKVRLEITGDLIFSGFVSKAFPATMPQNDVCSNVVYERPEGAPVSLLRGICTAILE